MGVSVSAVGVSKSVWVSVQSVLQVPVSAVGVIGQRCGCWSVPWVLVCAVGVGLCRVCW